jgi:hypothetical protein
MHDYRLICYDENRKAVFRAFNKFEGFSKYLCMENFFSFPMPYTH